MAKKSRKPMVHGLYSTPYSVDISSHIAKIPEVSNGVDPHATQGTKKQLHNLLDLMNLENIELRCSNIPPIDILRAYRDLGKYRQINTPDGLKLMKSSLDKLFSYDEDFLRNYLSDEQMISVFEMEIMYLTSLNNDASHKQIESTLFLLDSYLDRIKEKAPGACWNGRKFLIEVLLQQKQYESLLITINRYLEDNPDDITEKIFLENKIQTLLYFRRYEEALVFIHHLVGRLSGLVLDDTKELSNIYVLQAKCYIGLHKHKEAYLSLKAALRQNSQNQEALVYIKNVVSDISNDYLIQGQEYYIQNKTISAYKSFVLALQYDPNNLTVKSLIRRLKPDVVKKYIHKGELFLQQENYIYAYKMFQNALDIDGYNSIAADYIKSLGDKVSPNQLSGISE